MTYQPFLHTKILSKADQSDFRRNIWRTFIRPILAYLVACWAAALVLLLTFLVVDDGLQTGFGQIRFGVLDALIGASLLGLIICLLLALPMGAVIWLIRLKKLPRPMADIGLAMGLPFLGAALFFASQYTSFSAAWQGVMAALTFLPAGLVAGGLYWIGAGRPAA